LATAKGSRRSSSGAGAEELGSKSNFPVDSPIVCILRKRGTLSPRKRPHTSESVAVLCDVSSLPPCGVCKLKKLERCPQYARAKVFSKVLVLPFILKSEPIWVEPSTLNISSHCYPTGPDDFSLSVIFSLATEILQDSSIIRTSAEESARRGLTKQKRGCILLTE
jgi:hypothetical protein